MKKVILLTIIALVFGLSCSALALEKPRESVLFSVNGNVEVKTMTANWMPAQEGMILTEGDTIRTKNASTATLDVNGGGRTATVEVKENSQLQLATLLEDKQADTQTTLLDLSLGQILIKAKKLHTEKSKFEVKTPTSIVGVRGTTFSVTVEAVE